MLYTSSMSSTSRSVLKTMVVSEVSATLSNYYGASKCIHHMYLRICRYSIILEVWSHMPTCLHTHPVVAQWVRYISAMSCSESRISTRVASMSLTREWNSDRFLEWRRRMCSSPLSTENRRGSRRLLRTFLRAGCSSSRRSSNTEN